uniref:Uncharacterized protein n=1 Tax=Anopheles minimus TaxID=112268 RepID=A0A182VZS4_9DIPT
MTIRNGLDPGVYHTQSDPSRHGFLSLVEYTRNACNRELQNRCAFFLRRSEIPAGDHMTGCFLSFKSNYTKFNRLWT